MNNKDPKHMQDSIDQEYKFLANWDNFLRIFTESIIKTAKSITGFVEEHAEEVAPLLQKARIWYFPSMPTDIFVKLVNLKRHEIEPSIEQIEAILIDYYDENNGKHLRDMVDSWFDTQIFSKRKRIIEDALNAHIAGKFTLSVPALLPQLEGILRSYFREPHKPLKILFKEAIKEDYVDTALLANSLSDDILLTLVNDPFLFRGKLGDSFTPEKYGDWMKSEGVEAIPLNRDTILHGLQINYGTKANSLRVFFLLDVIQSVVSGKFKVILGEMRR